MLEAGFVVCVNPGCADGEMEVYYWIYWGWLCMYIFYDYLGLART